MGLNTFKCVVLTCSRLLSPSVSVYTINDHSLIHVTEYLYLGILFDSKMSFSPHINSITSKATRMLNFVKRNLYRRSRETKCMAYTNLVRPLLEYRSAVWDPYLQYRKISGILRWYSDVLPVGSNLIMDITAVFHLCYLICNCLLYNTDNI